MRGIYIYIYVYKHVPEVAVDVQEDEVYGFPFVELLQKNTTEEEAAQQEERVDEQRIVQEDRILHFSHRLQ